MRRKCKISNIRLDLPLIGPIADDAVVCLTKSMKDPRVCAVAGILAAVHADVFKNINLMFGNGELLTVFWRNMPCEEAQIIVKELWETLRGRLLANLLDGGKHWFSVGKDFDISGEIWLEGSRRGGLSVYGLANADAYLYDSLRRHIAGLSDAQAFEMKEYAEFVQREIADAAGRKDVVTGDIENDINRRKKK